MLGGGVQCAVLKRVRCRYAGMVHDMLGMRDNKVRQCFFVFLRAKFAGVLE